MDDASRRRALRAIGTAMVAPLAGCFDGDDRNADQGGSPSTTAGGGESPGPDPGTRATTATTTRPPIARREWRATGFDGPVEFLTLAGDARSRSTGRGPLYAATGDGTVARIAPADGSVAWTHEARGGTAGRVSTPVFVAGDAVYVVSETLTEERLRGHVESIDPATGDRRWTFSTRAFLRPMGVVYGSLYLEGAYIEARPSTLGPNQSPVGPGRVHAVDAGTGREEWRADVHRLVGGDVASHGVYVLEELRDDDPDRRPATALHAIGFDGDRRFTVETGSYGLSRPIATEAAVLAGAGGALGRYDPAVGTLEWSVGNWPGGPTGLWVARSGDVYAGSHPLVAVGADGSVRFRHGDGGRLVDPVGDDALYLWEGVAVQGIDPLMGTGKWVYRPDGTKYTHPRAVVDAGLLVNDGPTPEGAFRLVGEETGTVRGTFSTPGDHHAVTALGNRAFVGVDDGVIAYDVRP